MSCQMCNLRIGEKANLFINNIHCDECGETYRFGHKIVGIYIGMDGPYHKFNHDRKFYCRLCGERVRSFYLPCDDAHYFDMAEVNVEIEDEQEDY